MRPRDILAANLRALIADRPEYASHAALVKASGVSNGTLGRIRNAEVATTLDQLEGLAAAFGIEPWELLVPPERRPALHSVSDTLRAATSKPEALASAAGASRKRAGARS